MLSTSDSSTTPSLSVSVVEDSRASMIPSPPSPSVSAGDATVPPDVVTSALSFWPSPSVSALVGLVPRVASSVSESPSLSSSVSVASEILSPSLSAGTSPESSGSVPAVVSSRSV